MFLLVLEISLQDSSSLFLDVPIAINLKRGEKRKRGEGSFNSLSKRWGYQGTDKRKENNTEVIIKTFRPI